MWSRLWVLALLAPAVAAAEDDHLLQGDIRLGIGAGRRIDRSFNTVAVEVTGLIRIGLERAPPQELVLAVSPEAGVAGLGKDDYYFFGGCGVGFANDDFALALVPSFAGGRFESGEVPGAKIQAYGPRIHVEVDVVHFIGIQAAYLLAFGSGEVVNDARVLVSLNIIPMLRIVGR